MIQSRFKLIPQFTLKDEEGKERHLLFIILGADGLKKETLKLISWSKENFPLEF